MADEMNERNDRKTNASSAISNMAMNRSAQLITLVDCNENSISEPSQKARRKAYGEAYMVISDAVGALERGEKHRNEKMEQSMQRDSQRFKM